LKADLKTQMYDRMAREADDKTRDIHYKLKTDETFAKDCGLQTLHPRIRKTPDFIQREREKE